MLGALFIAVTIAWTPGAADGSLGQPNPEFHVRIVRPALAAAVEEALGGAARRLRRSDCSAILGDFTDAGGRTLQSNLEGLGRTAPAYLGLIRFHDGQGVRTCERTGILAVTSPGSRVVWVCGAFVLAQKRDRELAEVALLHEVLHTLGLRENPPSSLEITDRVVKRCGR